MTIVDSITRRKLVIVKQLFQHALIQSVNTHSIVNRMMAVISFDLAVETCLKTMVGALTSDAKSERTFPALIQQAEDILVKQGLTLPDKANILRVHDVRNDTQHRAKLPSEADVSDCRTYVRDFLKRLVELVWQIEYETISLVDMIAHEDVRRYLHKAEQAFHSEDYTDAVTSANIALSWTTLFIILAYKAEYATGDMKLSNNEMDYFINDLYDLVVTTSLGLNLFEIIKFKETVEEISFKDPENIDSYYFSYSTGGKRKFGREQAEYVIAYSTEAIIQIESKIGKFPESIW